MPAAPDDHGPARLFAYGTLQPGRRRWPVLQPYAVGNRPAVVPGRIYDSGYGWPVATFGDGRPVVPGTLVELDPARLAEVLALLDDVEATATDLLRRVRVMTTEGDEAWAYDCAVVPAGAVLIEAWSSADER